MPVTFLYLEARIRPALTASAAPVISTACSAVILIVPPTNLDGIFIALSIAIRSEA